MHKHTAIGIDIGGSHITSALIDLASGEISPGSVVSARVDAQADADSILSVWATTISASLRLTTLVELSGIGFAMPGPFDYEKGIALFRQVKKYESLYGVDVSAQLRARLHLPNSCHFRYMNDATAFAIGEAWRGKTANYQRSVAITLGTGFGSAFIAAGIPVVEGENVPPMGCVWHLPYQDGIADDYFSTRWFVKAYAARAGKTVSGAHEIFAAAASEPAARDVFAEFYAGLAAFLAPHLRVFAAQALVIGGNVAESFASFGHIFKAALATQRVDIDLHISQLKESAALIGSARLLHEDFWVRMQPLVKKM